MNARNIGSYLKAVPMLSPNDAAADATEIDGITIDRYDYVNNYLSALACVEVELVASAPDATLTTAMNMQDSADGSSWTDYGTAPDNLVLTAVSGALTQRGVLSQKVDLSGARRYVRCQATPDKSAGGDTAKIAGVLILGGADQNPPS